MNHLRVLRRLPLWGLLALAASPVHAQHDGKFSGETRVTAVDVVVEVMLKESLLAGTREPRKALKKRDFSLRLDDRPMSIVGLEASGPEAEPWNLLIYLDTTLQGDKELRWAAGLLGEQVEALVALGEVEIVVADPRPRTLLESTGDKDAIGQALSSWALEAVGDNALTTLRDAVLEASDEEALDPRELIALETAVVQDRLDAFLLRLAQSPPASPRRAVIPLGLGFDLHPEIFYLPPGTDPAPPPDAPLEAATEDLARTLAGYGWVTLPIAAPLPENRAKIRPGKRIGKFRLAWGNDSGLPGFTAAYEEDRDPEKADAHFEVGRQQRLAGDLKEAVKSFKRAIFHYYGDPRTAERQIRTYEALGETLQELGDPEAALRAEDAARELAARPSEKKKPSPRPASPAEDETQERAAGAVDIDPQAAFETLADATAGRAIRDRRDLEDALESLGRRLRLTYQWEGAAPGRPWRLAVSHRDQDFEIRAPSHGHLGIPATVAAARLRQIFLSELPNEAGDLEAEAVDDDLSEDSPVTRIAIDLEPHRKPGDLLRLSYGLGGLGDAIEIHHVALPAKAAKKGVFILEIPRDENRPGLALLLDNLTTRTWAATILDL